MRHVYTLLLYLLLPLVLLRLLWRSLRAPAYRQRWRERFGLFDNRPAAGGIWLHAVSVGEVQAIEPLVQHLCSVHPQLPITITTTTPTGSDRVRALFGESVFHVYYPYDIPLFINNFLQRVRPSILLMVETEIWPNLLTICQQQQIPSLLGNGRLSAKSARAYQRFGSFTRQTFQRITRLAVQSEDDARRFVEVGVPRERIRITGSIKFDMKIPASVLEQTQVLRRFCGEDRPVWVAASTHEGEDEQVLEAHRVIVQQLPNALLILVPRHPERFERVTAQARRMGFAVITRSSGERCDRNTSVFMGDSMGELPIFIGTSDAAFIGGSLVPTGGHNMLEASAQGVAVVFGPHVFNFPTIARLLLEEHAALQVSSSEELAQQILNWLGDASERSRYGENGRKVVEQNRGALGNLTELFEQMLKQAANRAG
jgi:3-deoxy-D-manno-octulosonic-acid transferase